MGTTLISSVILEEQELIRGDRLKIGTVIKKAIMTYCP